MNAETAVRVTDGGKHPTYGSDMIEQLKFNFMVSCSPISNLLTYILKKVTAGHFRNLQRGIQTSLKTD